MSDRVIPVVDQRVGSRSLPPPLAEVSGPIRAQLRDTFARPLRDLRISVTDRCNFRCSYCMPKEVFDRDYQYLPQTALLSFEEITRTARMFIALGVKKLRLTGGEPLLRKNLEILIEMLAALRTPEGDPLDITLTTNASLLKKKAAALKAAGLQRVTVSLDGLDDAVFRRMNDVDFPVRDVLEGIKAAQAVGFQSLKVNMVVKRGTNDDQILPMAEFFRGSGVALRFIEYMDVGATNGWRMDEVLPSAQVLDRLRQRWPMLALGASAPGETAQRWGYAAPDGGHDAAAGEIGLISSVTQAFCHDCNRARLSTEGQIYLCLFATHGYDLRSLLRSGADDAEISARIAALWAKRADRYSELRAEMPASTATAPSQRRVEMSYIGG